MKACKVIEKSSLFDFEEQKRGKHEKQTALNRIY
jgi:hypothetical protein